MSMRREKKKINTKATIALVIAFLMVSSIVGFIFGGQTDGSLNYNGFKISANANNKIIAKVNNQQLEFYYPPADVAAYGEDISPIINQKSYEKVND